MNYLDIEKKLITEFKETLFLPFIKAINDYNLVKENDRICVCISGGKDSMILAKCFQELKAHGNIDFEVVFLSMDPGYNKNNLEQDILFREKIPFFRSFHSHFKNKYAVYTFTDRYYQRNEVLL